MDIDVQLIGFSTARTQKWVGILGINERYLFYYHRILVSGRVMRRVELFWFYNWVNKP